MFAKLFETKATGQILVKIDHSDDGKPEVRVFFEPEGLGVCSFAVLFNDSDGGWNGAEKMFDTMTEEKAVELYNQAISTAGLQQAIGE